MASLKSELLAPPTSRSTQLINSEILHRPETSLFFVFRASLRLLSRQSSPESPCIREYSEQRSAGHLSNFQREGSVGAIYRQLGQGICAGECSFLCRGRRNKQRSGCVPASPGLRRMCPGRFRHLWPDQGSEGRRSLYPSSRRDDPLGQQDFLREGEAVGYSDAVFGMGLQLQADAGWPPGDLLSFLIWGDSVLESLCFPGHRMPFSVKTLTAVAACSFNLPDMAALTGATEAQSHVLANAMRAGPYVVTESEVIDIGCRSALGRVSQLLLGLEERLRKRRLSVKGTFQLPARQEHIADALGLTTGRCQPEYGQASPPRGHSL